MAIGSNQPSNPPALKQSFGGATPPVYVRAAGHPAALNALSAIEQRAAAVRERAIAHYKAFEDRWTAKEAIRIWERQLAQNKLHPAPRGVKQEVSPEAILRVAAQNVRARTIRRLSQIKAIKTRMSNAVVRNIDTPKIRQSFNEAAPMRAADEAALPHLRRRQ